MKTERPIIGNVLSGIEFWLHAGCVYRFCFVLEISL
jgi:hypothetical protein